MVKIRGFEVVKKDARTLENEAIMLPLRATKTSAGYDFYTANTLIIKPQQTVFFTTDIKAYMKDDEVLLLDIRSSLGKKDLMLVNTIGVIDSDYYGNVINDGNIIIGLRNLKPTYHISNYKTIMAYSNELVDIPIIKDLTIDNTVVINAEDRVAQGIFLKYLQADYCNTDVERSAGLGSTGK